MTPVARILAGGLVLRLALLGVPGFRYDRLVYSHWAAVLASGGPREIYAPAHYVDYPPGYLYALWAVGLAHLAVHGGTLGWQILLKIPPILADLVVVWQVRAIVRPIAGERRALIAAAVAAFAPPLWLDSAIWGQADSVPLAFALGAVLAVTRGPAVAALPLVALAVLVKPQSAAILPLVAFAYAGRPRAWRTLALSGALALGVAYLVTLPFAGGAAPVTVLGFLLDRYLYGVDLARHTTNGAFNLFALISSFFADDAGRLGPITYRTLGLGLVLAVLLTLWVRFAVTAFRVTAFRVTASGDRDGTRRTLALTATSALAYAAIFLFATRVHERYLLPALAFALPAAFVDRRWAAGSIWLGVAFTINCAFVLLGFDGGHHHPITAVIGRAVAAINLVVFAVLFGSVVAQGGAWRRGGDSNSRDL